MVCVLIVPLERDILSDGMASAVVGGVEKYTTRSIKTQNVLIYGAALDA